MEMDVNQREKIKEDFKNELRKIIMGFTGIAVGLLAIELTGQNGAEEFSVRLPADIIDLVGPRLPNKFRRIPVEYDEAEVAELEPRNELL